MYSWTFCLQRGVRGDAVSATVKVEFGDKALGESPKVDCMPEEPAEFNYHSSFNVTFEDPLTLDELACKPVVCKYMCTATTTGTHLVNMS